MNYKLYKLTEVEGLKDQFQVKFNLIKYLISHYINFVILFKLVLGQSLISTMKKLCFYWLCENEEEYLGFNIVQVPENEWSQWSILYWQRKSNLDTINLKMKMKSQYPKQDIKMIIYISHILLPNMQL